MEVREAHRTGARLASRRSDHILLTKIRLRVGKASLVTTHYFLGMQKLSKIQPEPQVADSRDEKWSDLLLPFPPTGYANIKALYNFSP